MENNIGEVENGSSLMYLKITKGSFAPGIWAGTEGLTIDVSSDKITYRVRVKDINFRRRIIKTSGNISVKLDNTFKVYVTDMPNEKKN